MSDATHNTCRARVTAHGRNLPVRHNSAGWDLRYKRVHPRSKSRVYFTFLHITQSYLPHRDVLLTRPLASLATVFKKFSTSCASCGFCTSKSARTRGTTLPLSISFSPITTV